MKMRITYKTNEELWQHEHELEKLGFVKTADCYWTQIFTDGQAEIYLIRE